jgi:hypothetical protein
MLSSGETSRFAANVSPQEQLRGVNKVGEGGHVASHSVAAAFRRALFREKAALFAPNVARQGELRRVNKVALFAGWQSDHPIRMVIPSEHREPRDLS